MCGCFTSFCGDKTTFEPFASMSDWGGDGAQSCRGTDNRASSDSSLC